MDKILLKWRNTNRFSQQEAAHLLGVAQTTYHYWESGKCKPTIKYLPIIAKVCQIDIAQLLPFQEESVKMNGAESHSKDTAEEISKKKDDLIEAQQTIINSLCTEIKTLQDKLKQ